MKTKLSGGVALLAALIVLASCASTRNSVFVDADTKVGARDYATAAKNLDGPQTATYYRDKDQVLRYLDTGMLYHMAGDSTASVKQFNEAEKQIEDNYTKSVTSSAASFLLNDYSLVYFGEAYEDIYLNVFKSIDFIRQGSFDGAYVEIRRVGTKLNLLEDKYGNLAAGMNKSPDAKGQVKAGKTEFHNSALARYISMLLYRGDNDVDNAAIDQKKLLEAFKSQPGIYDFPAPPMDSYLAPSKQVKLDVIGFAGRSPEKKANTLRLNTGAGVIYISQQKENDKGQLVTTSLNSIGFPGVSAGYNFKCQLPEMKMRPSQVARISVVVDGAKAGELALIEKMDKVALETYKLGESATFYKTVIRSVTKGVLAAKASSEMQKRGNKAGGLWAVAGLAAGVATNVAVTETEQADLRSARYFPGQAYVGEFAVEPGEHLVSVEYYSAGGQLLYTETFPKKVYEAKGLNVLASYDLQ